MRGDVLGPDISDILRPAQLSTSNAAHCGGPAAADFSAGRFAACQGASPGIAANRYPAASAAGRTK